MKCTRAAGAAATEAFDRIGRKLSVNKWMLAVQLAASIAALVVTPRVWAGLP